MIRTGSSGGARLHARALAAFTLLLFGVLVAPVLAQSAASGGLVVSGVVYDATGAVLPGVVVAAVSASRAWASTVSSDDGRYRLQVPAGVPFELRARRDGFAEHAVAVAGASGAITKDLTMRVGGVSDSLVVTAARSTQNRASRAGSVSVVDAADLAALGSASLADAVRGLPGLNVESTGREGALTALFSRGGESDHNLVLIDGVRVNQSGGTFDLSRVSAAEIQRIEVVRGAQSSLWGSDAMGSVVQVFTKGAEASGSGVAADLEAGSFGTVRGDARVFGRAGRLDYHAGATHRRTDGAFADRLRDDDRFDQTTFDAGMGAALGTRAALRTGLRASTAHGRTVGPFAYGPSDTGATYDSRDLSWHLDVSHTLGARVTGTASALYFRSKSLSADAVADPSFTVYALLRGAPGARFPDSPRLVRLLTEAEFLSRSLTPAQLGPGELLAFTPFGVSDFASSSETRFRRPALRYQADVDWGGVGRLSAGYEWERERNPLVEGFEVHNHSVFLQQQFARGERWFGTVGGRVDDKSRYGTSFSPRVSAGGFLVPATRGALSSLKVTASAGTGIKSPQFAELFGGAFADGNPELKPERARTVDAGAEATFADARARASATFFHSRYRDLVEFSSSDPFYRLDGRADFINVAGATARGWELEGALQRPLAGLTAAATYTYVDSQVTETVNTGAQFQPGQPLLRRPTHSGLLRAAYTRGRATASAYVRMVGQRHDSSFLFLSTVAGPGVAGGVTTDITVNPGYAVGGLGVDVRAGGGLTLFARGDNIGNASYESVLGYPGLPRAVMAGARWNVGLK